MDMERVDNGGFRVVDPFASLSGLFPIFGASQIVDPPGEGAALCGTRFVRSALFVVQKHAIMGIRPIEQGVLVFDEAGVFFRKLFRRESKMGAQAIQISAREIDIARRSGAALSAPGAFEF